MSTLLRIELIVVAIGFILLVIKTVNQRVLLLKYALLWLFLSVLMVLSSIFPGVVVRLTHLIGVETPSNLIFLGGFLCLLCLAFSLTIIVSKQTLKIKTLIQFLSLLEAKIEQEKGLRHGDGVERDD